MKFFWMVKFLCVISIVGTIISCRKQDKMVLPNEASQDDLNDQIPSFFWSDEFDSDSNWKLTKDSVMYGLVDSKLVYGQCEVKDGKLFFSSTKSPSTNLSTRPEASTIILKDTSFHWDSIFIALEFSQLQNSFLSLGLFGQEFSVHVSPEIYTTSHHHTEYNKTIEVKIVGSKMSFQSPDASVKARLMNSGRTLKQTNQLGLAMWGGSFSLEKIDLLIY